MPPLLPKESLLTPDARARLLSALLARAERSGVRVERHSQGVPGGGWYSPSKKLITLGNQESDDEIPSLAHELGHVEFNQGAVGRAIQSPVARGAAGDAWLIGGLVGAIAAGNLARRMALSGGVAAALQLPLLTGEAVASAKGHAMLREYGAPQELLDLHKRQMLKGFSTYLRPGTVGLAGAVAGSAFGAAVS